MEIPAPNQISEFDTTVVFVSFIKNTFLSIQGAQEKYIP
jgi:hypothetical protein